MIETFGDWVRRHRKLRGLTQESLARRVGCATTTIKKVESGLRRPSQQIAHLILDELLPKDLDRAELIGLARFPVSRDETAASGLLMASILPPPRHPLFGRATELATISRLIDEPLARLITLVGPPGVGKSRLVMQLADAVSQGFVAGVAYVDLRRLTGRLSMLKGMLAAVIENPLSDEAAGETADAVLRKLVGSLIGKQKLLVIDNVQRPGDVVPDLEDLVAACPALKILVTTDAVLGIYCEQVVRIQPLELPEKGKPIALRELAESPSVALFTARAQAVDHLFGLGQSNALAVAKVCIALDGLPLAIEIAAERSAALSVEEILDDLRKCRQGSPDEPGPRGQTNAHQCDGLCASILRCFSGLDLQEQMLFVGLGKFDSNFTIGCVESLLNTTSQYRWETIEVGSVLLSLVRKSLVVRVKSGEPISMFRILHPIRERAQNCLTWAGG